MTDEDSVRRFAEIVGYGSVIRRDPYGESRKPFWQWQASKKIEVARIAELLLPYIVAPRRRAQLNSVIEEAGRARDGWATRRARYGESGHS